MQEFLHTHETLFFYLTISGVVGLIGSLIVVQWILIKIPPDYFSAEKRKPCPWGNCPPVIRVIVLIIKNIIGVILILSGIIMLFIPGQGLLTIFAGIILTDFPYKYKLIRKIVKTPRILNFINKLREKAKHAPLKL